MQVGEIFEDDCMALVATNFLSFLIAETTIDALMQEDAAVIDKLQLSRGLKQSEVVSDAEIRCWADCRFARRHRTHTRVAWTPRHCESCWPDSLLSETQAQA